MTTAVIHLDRLTANISLLQELVGNCPMWPAIKANAYGRGAEIVARHLVGLGYDTLCVAHVEEAVHLIDVTELRGWVKLGDEVAIIGRQGEEGDHGRRTGGQAWNHQLRDRNLHRPQGLPCSSLERRMGGEGGHAVAFNLRNRNFLTLLDFSQEEIRFLLDLARELKAAKYAGTEQPRLSRKNIALIFEKTSTRTRCAFEIAAHDQGANVTYLGSSGTQIGVKESMKDTARVLARMYDGIEYRGFDQATAEELGRHGVPVWNGLTNEYHPTQILADLLTMMEHSSKPLPEIAFCFAGDGRGNMADSLLVGAAKMGMDFRLAAPACFHPNPALTTQCEDIARKTGARLLVTEDIAAAVKGVDFVYTDVWVSMGEPESVWEERIRLLEPYQINQHILEMTGNPNIKFMHCLPAFHNRETKIGEEIFQKYGLEAMEVTEEVFEPAASIVFHQAENRVHTIKAVMVATLGG
jgi:ornithine carbamoyltransferase